MVVLEAIRKTAVLLLPGIFLAGVLGSCTATPPSMDTSRLENSQWAAVYLSGRKIKEGVNLTLRFSNAGTVSGAAACNEFSAPVEMNRNGIRFGEISSTDQVCTSPVIGIDQVYYNGLRRVRFWELDQDSLLLKSSSGATLVKYLRENREPESG